MTTPRSEPVLVQLGARPEEAVQLVGPDARASYPADVRARLRADAEIILSRYPQARSALLPLLHLVQSEDGYLTPAGIEFCSDVIDLTGAEVTAVATFYSMYRREPTGNYRVGVCTNTLCAVMGGDAIMDALRDHLDIDHGETTADGAITLEHIECNAACDFAPVMMVNWEFFDNRTPASARELVDALRSGAQVTPTRGAPLCTFRETERILAGFADDRLGALESSGSAGEASLAGLRYAREHSMTAPRAVTGSSDDHPDLGAEAVAETVREKPAPAPSATVPPQPNTTETDPPTKGK
ncbi:NADH-quinone oxidoreductase subunit NuoE [Rhodococcus sp. IEGM 1401]|uniref:NADH-quinone oxidoreductase subunit NuoE n=1 Tax=unclassified Rhodococcus (in: high G+C Gram-positive bacteria) TaxID=192944 RepID=UPI000B9BBFF9|nr:MULTISPECIES: NADH-quinone oxidoreductase subunit NuoE [unclassified Rhodococcus (in: high G+C Gram-positive bacteria)]MCZ4559626.1 NADH-quinone oxidoreductase subunit NuoE [Rhodococcus sp. IEGM 1401]MDI6630351.1 NADH-quinone oxidoreductase subunit NuoE [Rhodococcus sp. (in: high G+C Gram-positive bacteria)]MDI9919421.1 NADH-quinone oxidoreductase subunit NuoE [Rhodococcus sp. IEGM 1372]MDV8032206.1 NADH-quinone oxidoreductase subunit NuoE [Rhodococcus sp. IEGM 1414]OZE31645.1 NADH-quinone 